MRRSNLLALAGLLLAGCNGAIDFSVKQTFDVDTTSIPAGTAFAPPAFPVDLSQNADVWKHKDKVKSLEIHSATATVKAPVSAPAGTTLSGTLHVMPEGAVTPTAEQLVGTITNLTIAEGAVATLAPAAGVNKVINDALAGTGKFQVKGSFSTSAGATFPVELVLHMSMNYKL